MEGPKIWIVAVNIVNSQYEVALQLRGFMGS
jgi:hypothetical protein